MTWLGIIFICIAAVILFAFGLYAYDAFRLWRLDKKYDETDDKSRQGELIQRERRGSDLRGLQEYRERESPIEGDVESKRRFLLPTSSVGSVEQNRPRPRGIFRRTRR